MSIVYILTNPAMPGLVKIGCSERTIEERMRELSSHSGIPLPFECFLAVDVPNPYEIEAAMHHAFGDRRINPRKEFFELSPDRPAAILRIFQDREKSALDVTPASDIVESKDEQIALDKERNRRASFRFSQVGIISGTELVSAFDPRQTCIVHDDRRVQFRGEITSLSNAALIVAHETGRRWAAVQGPQFWTYQGRSLTEMREEAEDVTEQSSSQQ